MQLFSKKAKTTQHQQLKLVIVGHVDHGKSTLVGRLLHDTHSLPEGKFEAIQASCKKRGMPFEWSFLLDALQAERDQGVTIDTTQIWLRTKSRDVVIIDAPGHKEFLKNMITGAAQADAALLIIDAKEGIKEQSKRHGYLLHLLGIRQIAVIVNKMDMVGYDGKIFAAIEKEYRVYLKTIGVEPTCFIPVSAREGDGITKITPNLSWYKGAALLAALEQFEVAKPDEKLPLRFTVQDVYKFDERRIIAGRVESGVMKVGDTLLFSPVGSTAKIASIESWPRDDSLKQAQAGQMAGITLSDQIFVERGHIASHEDKAPVHTNLFRARIFWLAHKPLMVEKRYKIKLGTATAMAEIRSIEHVIDADTLKEIKADRVERNNVAEVVIRTRSVIALEEFQANSRLGRFVILQDYEIAGGGTISMEGFYDQRKLAQAGVKSQNLSETDYGVDRQQRALQNGHFGGILWFTGLSGSGKSTIAKQVQKRLFDRGYQVFVLDGDNVRKGLNRDLGFSPEERSENIRRVAETAALFARAGIIVIASFIAPYREDRRRARAIAPDFFHNIYIKASVQACEQRDTKGLYKKAREGKIPDFTGVSAPYEEPQNPDLVLDTEAMSIQACVDALMKYVDHALVEPVKNLAIDDVRGQDYAGTGI